MGAFKKVNRLHSYLFGMLHKGIVSYLYNDTTSEVAISGIYVLIY